MSWVRAMYWMRSMWCVSLSSWSMLSLAARWRWNCLLFGEPGSHQTWGKSSELCKLWASKSRQKWHVIQEKASINCFWGDFFYSFPVPWYDRRCANAEAVYLLRGSAGRIYSGAQFDLERPNFTSLSHLSCTCVCLCVYPTHSRHKATHSWLLEPPAQPMSVYHARTLPKY